MRMSLLSSFICVQSLAEVHLVKLAPVVPFLMLRSVLLFRLTRIHDYMGPLDKVRNVLTRKTLL